MKGKAIIFSAPSGAGKTSIVRELLQRIPELKFSISATTRQRRDSEIDGRDYHFLTKESFQKKIEDNQLLEWEEVYEGIFYGTLQEEVEKIWSEGNHVIFDVDVKGGINLKESLGQDAISIFIKVSNPEILKERLRKRATESEETLRLRVDKATIELKEEGKFDYAILNENLSEAIKQAEDLVKRFVEKK